MELRGKTKGFILGFNDFMLILLYELVALFVFNLADLHYIYLLAGIILALLFIPYAIFSIKPDNINQLFWLAIPFLSLVIIGMVSGFNIQNSGILNCLVYLFGALAFLFLGYTLHNNPGFKLRIFLLAIGICLALVVLISTFATVADFGLFHLWNLKGQIVFYNGTEYAADSMALMLVGFAFREVPFMNLTSLGLILTTALLVIPFIRIKKNPLLFTLLCLIGTTGLLNLTLLFDYRSLIIFTVFLITDIFVAIFKWKGKVLQGAKITFIVLGAIFGIYLILFFVNAQEIAGFSDFIRSNPFFDRLFNGFDFLRHGQEIVRISNYGNIMNFFLGGSIYYNSGSFLFDVFSETGLVGFALFLWLLVTAVILIFHYVEKGRDSKGQKTIVIMLITVLIANSILGYSSIPYVFNANLARSFLTTPNFVILAFLLGYISCGPLASPREVDLELVNHVQKKAVVAVPKFSEEVNI